MRAGISATILLLLGSPAHAQPLPPIELGPIPHFDTDEARRCAGDIVVWADAGTGYFYPKSRPEYGHTSNGTFTCLAAALAANYWDVNPFSGFGGAKIGREFPIDPTLLGPGS